MENLLLSRHVREFVEWLVSESMLIYYISNFKDSFWPGGKLAPPYPERTSLVGLTMTDYFKRQLACSIIRCHVCYRILAAMSVKVLGCLLSFTIKKSVGFI